jgi:fimbrial chaperone protein
MYQKPYGAACRPPVAWFVLATLIGVFAAASAHAQSLEVAPVRIEMAAGQTTTVVTVTNRGMQPVGVQARAFGWNQSANADHLSPTKDVLLSPPIAEIAPGETQLIRILVRKPAGATEATYRLLIDQIPPAQTATSGFAVQIALRLSLPIFVQPPRRVASDLEWRVVSSDGTRAELVARNRGGRHVRLSKLTLVGPSAPDLGLPNTTAAYVLPGAERRWPISGKLAALKQGTALRVTGASDEGRIDAALVLVTGP